MGYSQFYVMQFLIYELQNDEATKMLCINLQNILVSVFFKHYSSQDSYKCLINTIKDLLRTGLIHLDTWLGGYKKFILNSAEHEILNAHKYTNIKKFSIFRAHISLECYFSCPLLLKCQQSLHFKTFMNRKKFILT